MTVSVCQKLNRHSPLPEDSPQWSIDITALYCCLDDFCKVFEDEAHRLIPSQLTIHQFSAMVG